MHLQLTVRNCAIFNWKLFFLRTHFLSFSFILIVYRVLEAFSLNATLIFTLIIIIIIIIILALGAHAHTAPPPPPRLRLCLPRRSYGGTDRFQWRNSPCFNGTNQTVPLYIGLLQWIQMTDSICRPIVWLSRGLEIFCIWTSYNQYQYVITVFVHKKSSSNEDASQSSLSVHCKRSKRAYRSSTCSPHFKRRS